MLPRIAFHSAHDDWQKRRFGTIQTKETKETKETNLSLLMSSDVFLMSSVFCLLSAVCFRSFVVSFSSCHSLASLVKQSGYLRHTRRRCRSSQVVTSRHKSSCRAKAKERPWFPDVGRIGLPAMVPKSVSELSQTNPNMLKLSLLAKVETEMQ